MRLILLFATVCQLIATAQNKIMFDSWIDLPYPRLASQAGISGMVKATIRVSRNGDVELVGSPAGPRLLVDSVIAHLRQLRLEPFEGEREIAYQFQLGQAPNGVNRQSSSFQQPNSFLITTPIETTGRVAGALNPTASRAVAVGRK